VATGLTNQEIALALNDQQTARSIINVSNIFSKNRRQGNRVAPVELGEWDHGKDLPRWLQLLQTFPEPQPALKGAEFSNPSTQLMPGL